MASRGGKERGVDARFLVFAFFRKGARVINSYRGYEGLGCGRALLFSRTDAAHKFDSNRYKLVVYREKGGFLICYFSREFLR